MSTSDLFAAARATYGGTTKKPRAARPKKPRAARKPPAFPVIIRAEKGSKKGASGVEHLVAIFPTEPGTNNPNTMTCYTRPEAHGICSSDYAGRKTRPATPGEKKLMLRELKRVGYTNLKVVARPSSHHRKARVKAIGR